MLTKPLLAGGFSLALTKYLYPDESFSVMGKEIPAYLGTGGTVTLASFISHSLGHIVIEKLPATSRISPASVEKIVAASLTGLSAFGLSKLTGNDGNGLNFALLAAISEAVGDYTNSILFSNS